MASERGTHGTIQLGAVPAQVTLYKISAKNDTALDTAGPDGEPVVEKKVGILSGKIIPTADCQKGVFGEKPKTSKRETWSDFHAIPEEALTNIALATKLEVWAIEHFIPIEDVPFERALGCYYIAPQSGAGGAGKTLALIREALEKTGKAGVFKLALRSRQQAAVVYPKNGALFVNTLAWAEDFVNEKVAAEPLDGVEVNDAHLNLAVGIIEALSADVDVLDTLTDDLRPLKDKLVADALAGKTIEAPKIVEPVAEVHDLEALLKASIAGAKKAPAKKAPAGKASSPKPRVRKAA